MEKTKKVNLTTVLLIIAIIIIVVLGAVAFIFYRDKSDAESKLNSLTSQVSGLENTVTSLREEQSKVKEDSSNKSSTSNNKTTVETEDLDDEKVKDTLEMVLKLYGDVKGAPSDIIETLKLGKATSERSEDGMYVKTNVKYADYKNAVMEYVSEDCFDRYFTENYKEIDGILYYRDGFGSADEYEIDSVKNKKSNTYVADAWWLNQEGEKSTEYTITFDVDDEYIITSFDMEKK